MERIYLEWVEWFIESVEVMLVLNRWQHLSSSL
jgi:hypothetical protein